MEKLHRRGTGNTGLAGNFLLGLDVDLHALGSSAQLIEHALELGLKHVAGTAGRRGVDDQQGLAAVVIELAQGKTSLLP